MNSALLRKVLKAEFQPISHNRNQERFLPLWEKYIDLMISMLADKFDNVFILEIYFTSQTANGAEHKDINKNYAEKINNTLLSMYEKIRNRSDCILISIDRSKMITGREVEWGGPTYTHFIEETYALFCDQVIQMMSQGKSDFSFIAEASLERARAHEKTISELTLLKEEMSKTRNEFLEKSKKYERRISELSDEVCRRPAVADFEAQRAMISQRDGELEALRQATRTHQRQMQAVESELAKSHLLQAQLERELEFARQSVFARTKKSIARMTYRVRRGNR